jgi:PEP-CTERM/exosortase A-associated glycosyltransferase
VDHGTTREGSVRYRLSKQLETWLLKRADAVTTICEGLRSDMVARGINAARITVIPNAVNTDEFPLIAAPDAELKQRLGLNGCFVLGFIGSFYGYEGLDLLVAALPRVLRDYPDARLLLVGGGFEENALRKQVAALGLDDKVVFTGRVPHREVARYYSVVDLLLYPRKSMRLTETVTPLKPLEAMSQGRLFAASNVGGHRELVRDGETGFLFEPGQPDAVAAAVTRARGAQAEWPTMRAAGRHFVENERNWRNSVARYRGVYEPLLERRHA